MVINSDFSYVNFRGKKETTSGCITSVEETSAKESKRTVYAHHYEYTVAGEPLRGVSYTTGSPSETGLVDVEYLLDNPRKSHIAGMRPTLFSWGAQFIAIIPIVGALLMFFGTKRGLRKNHLLANGLFATGTFVDRKETNAATTRR